MKTQALHINRLQKLPLYNTDFLEKYVLRKLTQIYQGKMKTPPRRKFILREEYEDFGPKQRLFWANGDYLFYLSFDSTPSQDCLEAHVKAG